MTPWHYFTLMTFFAFAWMFAYAIETRRHRETRRLLEKVRKWYEPPQFGKKIRKVR